MRNIKLLIEYDGTNYHGWQTQPNGLTIQEVIEQKIEVISQERIHLAASGRTDAGVHAWGQVANFKTSSKIPLAGIHHGLNSLLPPDIVIKSAEEVSEDFHAQLSAKRKTYVYKIFNQPSPSAIYRNYAWHLTWPCDIQAMNQASQVLIGQKDFSSFQGAHADTVDPVREVFRADWSLEPAPFLCFTIEADGFLKNMVRNIVGTLIEVGKGKIFPERFREILEAKDRRQAGRTAPPQGLFLLRVEY